MNDITFHSGGPIKLPSGVSVGDEFRVAGKVRVTAIAEDLIDVTSYGSAPAFVPGEMRYTLVVQEMHPE